MTLSLSAKAKGIAPSPTLAIDSKTKALIAAGADIVNLSVGEPDFPTPAQASLAGIAAIVNNFTKYTDASGIVELRRGIADKLRDENGLDYAPEEIIVSSGAKQSLYNIFVAILDPGDEVLLPAPYWVSYPEQIRLADGVPVVLETTEATGFKVTAQQVEQAITPKTKAVLLNSPSNPTGAMYSKDEIVALAEVIERHDLFVISDEIYERLTYGQEHYSIARVSLGLRDRTFVVNGFSKTHAMTGWRVGYVAAPQHLVKAMASFQSHTTANPSSISQKAALGALGTFDPATVTQFRARRDAVLEAFSRLPGLTCASPDGAFYVFPNVGAWLGQTYTGLDGSSVTVQTVDHLCELLLTDALVATVPGTGFGAPWNLRMSYATSMEALQKGLTRMTAFFGRFS
ncbi:MAG: pyridoxal phosphate-dependent aminotransferase [Firmicutes bacterium]|nr:pyridoxal phosphate-dependent aminotransferase [Bacillota bacterium]